MTDFETLLREVLGESFSRLTQFQREQIGKLTDKLREVAREAMHDDVARVESEIADLRQRVARLEAERVQQAAEEV